MFSRLCVIALVALACGTSPGVQPPLNQPFSLRIGESARFSDADLTVTFRAVSEDSRCPRDVVCVWAGNGQVQLEVQLGTSVRTAMLNTTTQPHEVSVDSYRLALVELAPVPHSQHPIPPSQYVATLRLQAN